MYVYVLYVCLLIGMVLGPAVGGWLGASGMHTLYVHICCIHISLCAYTLVYV